MSVSITRIAQGNIQDSNIEKELGWLAKQLQNIFNDTKVVTTTVFYSAPTSGDPATIKNTITFNAAGQIISWTQA